MKLYVNVITVVSDVAEHIIRIEENRERERKKPESGQAQEQHEQKKRRLDYHRTAGTNVDHRRQRTTDDHHLWAPPPRTRVRGKGSASGSKIKMRRELGQGLRFLSTRQPPNGRHQRRPSPPKNDRRPPPVGTTVTDTTEREGNCAVWVEIENEKRTRLVADCIFPQLDHHRTTATQRRPPPPKNHR